MDEKIKLAHAGYNFTFLGSPQEYPWSPSDIDKMESIDLKEYRKVVESCRFFYRRDSIASTVINKLVDIGINDLVFQKNGLSDNEFRVFNSLKQRLKEFAEEMALEYLITGLVIPEIKYAPVGKDVLNSYGIKKYSSLTLPVSLWVRDSSTVILNKSLISDRPTIYIEIPEDLIYFIKHNGEYPDGSKDIKLYQELLAYYPDFVAQVRAGAQKIQIENDMTFRRRVTADTAYPIPYLYPAIESLKHKRNLRRMDYSIASRVIGAIMLVRLGSDEFPVTVDDQDAFQDIKNQMMWRDGQYRNIERIFQLFANHTLQIDWIMPETKTLLDNTKYESINEDILVALGFPRILITGETQRSNTSDAQYASMSPVKTMIGFRDRITTVLNRIVNEIATANRFDKTPTIAFKPLQLAEYKTFVDGIGKLYDTGNLSRTSYDEFFGFTFNDELELRKQEQQDIKSAKVPEFAPNPHSQNPLMGDTGNQNNTKQGVNK